MQVVKLAASEMKSSQTSAKKSAAKPNKGERKTNWQGMNWITQEKRLAIYLRDGCACAYCGASIEQGAQLTLDHLVPHAKGGTNHETNLVTCCHRCNSSRGDRAVATFAKSVAGYVNHGVKPADILAHIKNSTRRSLAGPKAEAKTLIARRGSAAKVLAEVLAKGGTR